MSLTIYRLLGFLFLILAGIGLILPLVPATPFILLAAGCFSRSSERMHTWLITSAVFGPVLANWEKNRCIPCEIKWLALLSMLILGGTSMIFAVQNTTARVVGGLLMLTGAVVVANLRTCPPAGGPLRDKKLGSKVVASAPESG